MKLDCSLTEFLITDSRIKNPIKLPQNEEEVEVTIWKESILTALDFGCTGEVLDKDNNHLGFINLMKETEINAFLDFLSKFGKAKEVRKEYQWFDCLNQKMVKEPCYGVKFKTLFTGYQLFKKSYEQFRQVLKTAQTEEEFYVLAGVS